MVILPILATSLILFASKGWENVPFELHGNERAKRCCNCISFLLIFPARETTHSEWNTYGLIRSLFAFVIGLPSQQFQYSSYLGPKEFASVSSIWSGVLAVTQTKRFSVEPITTDTYIHLCITTDTYTILLTPIHLCALLLTPIHLCITTDTYTLCITI